MVCIHDLPGGGPAFPSTFNPQDVSLGIVLFSGMTIRDFLIAHAPTEPPEWFEPKMPPKPEPATLPEGMTPEDKGDYNAWRNGLHDLDEMERPLAKKAALEQVAARRAIAEWDAAWLREKTMQWPAAWADEQLRRRAQWILEQGAKA